jgi:hypothetical protein
MTDPKDNRWLPVLAKEWGIEDRLGLHLACKSGAAPEASAAPAAP